MTNDSPEQGGEALRAVARELGTRTLDELDPPAWPPAPEDASRLVRTAHALRSIPLLDLDAEALRLLVAQQVALPVTVPLALGVLGENPLAEGDFYPGDLLMAVLAVPAPYWRGNPVHAQALRDVLTRLDPTDPDYPVLGEGDVLARTVADFLARLRD
ncbi:contact-dependent growth inhibition system immunity protein [Miniimonas arenae]|uniref:contact-dependent growth inhibition system immunity protein n=1 Tax=Miniimonas arenae TaxID=676201 RepID=UPI0028B0A8EA|nr:contact-dependent growth inhibition system immunity protein [Miniimonas arenae]